LELVESVRTKGILQPILVRPKGPDHYEIIAGERRWRAAQAAGFHEVPVIVKNFSNVEALEVALIENIQRHDLNAIEEALGYKRLIEEFSHTQNEVSKMIGKSRSHIANILRLLSLPLSVQQLMREEKISMGHARALITAEDPETLARLVISQGLSVRQIEKMATSKSSTGSGSSSHSVTGKSGKDVDILALENELSSTIGLKITLDPQGAEQGILKIHYKSLDQLDDICSRLNKVPNN
jgi:ParB family transcriptional regulator, chromosome partitioning protein